jgi:hypothetical protein
MVVRQAKLRHDHRQIMADAERHALTFSPFRDWMAVVEHLNTRMFVEMGFTSHTEHVLMTELLQAAALPPHRFDPVIREHAFWVTHNRTLDYTSSSPSSNFPPLIPLDVASAAAPSMQWLTQQEAEPEAKWLVLAGSQT